MADDTGQLRQVFEETAFLYGGNAAYVEDLFEKFGKNPGSVDPSWRAFFESLREQPQPTPEWARARVEARRDENTSALDYAWPAVEAKTAKAFAAKNPEASSDQVHAAAKDSIRAIMMIRAYRIRGHLASNLDPLGIEQPALYSELDPASYGFSDADLDRPIFLDFVLGLESATLREILDIMRRTYCGSVGVQYMHIVDTEERAWIQERIEGRDKEISFTPEGKIAILRKLIEAETFERFLHRRFPGTKRFGLDGGEAVVPALEQVIKRGGAWASTASSWACRTAGA
jgi:2-oxoglutarate dehydrogenase E1 component